MEGLNGASEAPGPFSVVGDAGVVVGATTGLMETVKLSGVAAAAE